MATVKPAFAAANDPLLMSDEAVRDRYHLVHIIMYMLGIGSLFPWNALITPVEYFRLRLAGSAFEASFESILTTTFTCLSLITILALQPFQNTLSLRFRVLASLVLLLVVFSTTAVLAIVPLTLGDAELIDALSSGAEVQFVMLIVSGGLAGIAQAALTGAAMSYASFFDQPHFIQAVSGGQGVAGLTVTLGSLFVSLPTIVRECSPGPGVQAAASAEAVWEDGPVRAVEPQHARDVVSAAAVYFCASVLVLLACLVGFLVMEKLPFTRARKRIAERRATLRPGSPGAGSPRASSPRASSPTGASSPAALRSDEGCGAGLREAMLSSPVADSGAGCSVLLDGDDASTVVAVDDADDGDVLRRVWRWAASVTLIYAVTIALFPSLTSTIVSVSPSCGWKHAFGPVLFVVFNLFDTIGRNLPWYVRGGNSTLTISAMRGERPERPERLRGGADHLHTSTHNGNLCLRRPATPDPTRPSDRAPLLGPTRDPPPRQFSSRPPS